MTEKASLILDLHIPYCIRPEYFQDRYFAVGSNPEKNLYLVALGREILSWEGDLDDYEIMAVRLSGGSASVMSPDLLGRVLTLVRQKLPVARGAECSYDAIPNTICTPSLTGIAAGHPNRVELMMHSDSDRELRSLNCPFSMQDTRNAIRFFQKFHLNNVGLTVSYGIPGQTPGSWRSTLRSCTILQPGHITLSPLDATSLEDARRKGLPAPAAGTDTATMGAFPEEEERFAMYCTACDFLKEAGYLQYGAGLFCLPGHEYRYAALERNGTARISMGVGAISRFEGMVVRNTNNLRLYMANAGDFRKLTAQVSQPDTLSTMRRSVRGQLGLLRKVCPDSLDGVAAEPGTPVPDGLRAELEALTGRGWLARDSDGFILTRAGEFHYAELLR